MRSLLLVAGATAAAAKGNTVLCFGDSWGDTGPTYKVIQDALDAHGVTGTVKSAAVGGTTACGWAKDPQALVTAAKKQFGDEGPDFVWYTAGGNDLISDSTFHSCTKNAGSLEAAQKCYDAATDIANKCSSTMFEAFWKAFPNSKIMQCNYDMPCEGALCRVMDVGYLGNYCGSNVTCLNNMGVAFQNSMVGRMRQKYSAPQYTGLLIGGTGQAANGDTKAQLPADGKDGVPDLDASGPCDQQVACVHPKYGSKWATAIGEVFYDQWLKKYV